MQSATLIDPTNIINFDRTEEELQLFFLFCVVVAGKRATLQAQALSRFLQMEPASSPFLSLTRMIERGTLLENLKESRIGQFNKLARAFTEVIAADLNLRECTLEDLHQIHGIGYKTARYFLVYTRKEAEHAVLDTHILRFIREELGVESPRATPSSIKEYQRLEKVFLDYVRSTGKTVPEVDLSIWVRYSGGNKALVQ